MKIFNLIICTLFINSFAYADASHAPIDLSPSSVTTIGSANLSTLNLKIELSDDNGIGYFFPQANNTEEQYINQGYASLNVFHYVDAYRSFKQAYTLNNDSIFALVGMSYAILTQDTSKGGATLSSTALNEAFRISNARSISKQESAWLGFAKAFFMIKVGDISYLDDKNAVDASKAFQNLAAVDGNNLEFKTFVHWIILNNSNFQYIKSLLDSVIAIEPNHAGARHYSLHIAEMTDDIATAQMHGKVLITLALGNGHAQHMYGHTLPQTGQWKEALEQFLIADDIHKKWATSNGVNISEDWHYAHNLDLLAATYLGLGDYENALDNWSIAMSFDARAILKMIGLALAVGELDRAEEALVLIEVLGPQYKNYVSFLRSEQGFLSASTIPKVFPSTDFGALLKTIYEKSSSQESLYSQLEVYFVAKFKSGGFDGWSNGFVELMRARNISSKMGLTELEQSLKQLEVRARSGQL